MQDSVETTLHSLIYCLIARDCWRRIFTFIELSMKLHSISDLILLVKPLKGKHRGETWWKQAVVMYAVWLIWKQWNDVVFSGAMPIPSNVLLHALSHAKEVWYIDAKCDSFLL